MLDDTPNLTDSDDLTLVQCIAHGDHRALELLYQRHGLALLRYLIGLLADQQQAEDALQDVLLSVWRGAAGFRGQSSVRTWLISIARYRAITIRTRSALPADGSLIDAETVAGDTPPLLDVLLAQSDAERVRAALAQLPAAQRETLELIFYQALSGTEAAQVLGVPAGTVKSRLHRAFATLRGLLSTSEIPYEH